MMKPNIVEVISQYLPLRRFGREWAACCPFHEDKHPSLYVNEEKGVFLCRGCGEAGDVFDFLTKWSGKTFREVSEQYGIHGHNIRIRPDDSQIAAQNIRRWVNEFSLRLANQLRDIGQAAQLARDLLATAGTDRELLSWFLARCTREWLILVDLHDDIYNPDYVLNLYEQREALEGLLCQTH